MSNSPKYYDTLDELPIWNWDMIHKEGSYRFLCKKGEPDKYAGRIYRGLLDTFDRVNLPALQAKRDVAVKCLDLVAEIVSTSKDPIKIEKAGVVLGGIMASGTNGQWLDQVSFVETSEQKRLLSLIKVSLKASEEINAYADESPQTLNQKVVTIERLLETQIDSKICSVNLFMEYERQAAELARRRNGSS